MGQQNFGQFFNDLFSQFRRVNEQRQPTGSTPNANATPSGDNTRTDTPRPTPLASFLSDIQGGEVSKSYTHSFTSLLIAVIVDIRSTALKNGEVKHFFLISKNFSLPHFR